MVAQNDDDAFALLAAKLPPPRLQRIYKDLLVNYAPERKDFDVTLSASSAFFRVLFNASYLSEEMSEKALRFLARSSFRNGMAAGVPADLDVASTMSARSVPDGSGGETVQVQEVGIIYHPRRPFLLGIIVRGAEYDELADVIRDITELIFHEVDRQSTGED
jgi:hypothetical protein